MGDGKPSGSDEATTPVGRPLLAQEERAPVVPVVDAIPAPTTSAAEATAPAGRPLAALQVEPPAAAAEPTAVAGTPLPALDAAAGSTARHPSPAEPTALSGTPLARVDLEATKPLGRPLPPPEPSPVLRSPLAAGLAGLFAAATAAVAVAFWPVPEPAESRAERLGPTGDRPPPPVAPAPTFTVPATPDQPARPVSDAAPALAPGVTGPRSWRCAQLSAVGAVLEARAIGGHVFTLTFADEPGVVVTAGPAHKAAAVRQLRDALSRCREKTIEAQRTNERFAGLWAGPGKVKGVEVKLEDLSLRSPGR